MFGHASEIKSSDRFLHTIQDLCRQCIEEEQKAPKLCDRNDPLSNLRRYREWKGSRWKYLLVGAYAYWTIWPVLNRARSSTVTKEDE